MKHQQLEFLKVKAAQAGVPMTATFELTARCNMHCNMCYIHRPEFLGGALAYRPLSFWLDLAEQAKAAGTLVIVVTGGETFLYPYAEELLEKLLGMGFIISLNTNGTLLDERRIAWLTEHRPTKINISLYGASDETYGRLCHCPDGFSRVSSAIDALLERGHNVYLNGVLTPENIDDIPAMVEFSQKRGLVLHGTAYLFPPGRYGCHTLSSRLSPKEAAQAQLLLGRLQDGEEAQYAKCVQQIQAVDALLRGQRPAQGGFHAGDGCSRSNCGGGRTSYAISWDGQMMMCVNGGISVSLDDYSFSDAWDELRRMVNELPLPTDCEKCPLQVLCNACPAMLYSETGRYDQLSEYTCAYMWENYQARVEIVKAGLKSR